MKRIRIRVIIFTSWLIFFYIIDRLLNPIEISNAAIALVFVMSILMLGLPRKPVMSLWVAVFLSIIALIVIKLWEGKLTGDLGMSLTILEVCMLGLTTLLGRWVSSALGEFENTVAQSTLWQGGDTSGSGSSGTGSIYREVRRARNHQRPLALISISIEDKSVEPELEKMVQEIQLSMMKQYKLQELSKTLCDELEDCAVIVRDTDRFLAVLPETLPVEIPVVLNRLRKKASEQIGVELKIGVATLPQDSFTFEGLVDRATQAMQNDQELQPHIVLDHSTDEHRIN